MPKASVWRKLQKKNSAASKSTTSASVKTKQQINNLFFITTTAKTKSAVIETSTKKCECVYQNSDATILRAACNDINAYLYIEIALYFYCCNG